ncbi:MAG TPA: GDYXXLXY domain-containing protein [Acidobacteriaceae bacterium]|jgi:uncharacterized membrane-anchored protein|nr:GDYXXLXY domain-containing protein [Acidobacteriaceae bacterium]
MRQRRAALALLAVQLLLVLSVAGKYLYERRVCPRVWVRTQQFDPNQLLRGRYLALHLLVDACSLPHDPKYFVRGYQYHNRVALPGHWTWNVTLAVENGHLVPRLADRHGSPNGIQQVWLREGDPCDKVPLLQREEYFVPDQARGPLPLQRGQELWVEVTVPPSGPPRPIQLALSSQSGFQPIRFE